MHYSPGIQLEDYLLWIFKLSVDYPPGAQVRLGVASDDDHQVQRQRITLVHFSYLIQLSESIREHVEAALLAYDGKESWKQYHDRELSDLFSEEYIATMRRNLSVPYLRS